MAEAIAAREKADALVAERREAIRAGKEVAWGAEAKLEKLEAAIGLAEEADVSRAASTLAKNTSATVPVPWQADSACRSLEIERDRLKLTRAAIVKLQSDLAVMEDDAAEAASEVMRCAKMLVLPTAEKLLSETEALKTRLAVNLQALAELVRDGERLSFQNMLRGERARSQREAVLQEVARGTERLRFAGNAADYAAAEEASAKWRQVLSSLKNDPETPLP